MYFDQGSFDIRCEWGEEGLWELLPVSRAVVIVDVLSFSTCVEIAVGNGAIVYPYRTNDHTAAAYARSRSALLANTTREFEGGRLFAVPFVPGGHTRRHRPGSTLSKRVRALTGGRRYAHVRGMSQERNGPCRLLATVRNRNQRHPRGGTLEATTDPPARDRGPDRRGCGHSCAGRHPFAGSRNRRPRF